MKLFSKYVPISGHTFLVIKETMSLPWTPQKIWPKKTQTFPWVRIWLKPHFYASNWTYTRLTMGTHLIPTTAELIQLEPHTNFNIYKHVYKIEHTHTCTNTHTHICTNLRTLCPWYVPSFQHMKLNVRVSTHPDPNPILGTYVYQTNPNPNPDPNKKLTRNCANSKPISDSGFHYRIFSDKTHNQNPFKTPITDSWFFIPHYLAFNPAYETHKILPSAITYYHVPSLYFFKSIKQKSEAIPLWPNNTTRSCFVI